MVHLRILRATTLLGLSDTPTAAYLCGRQTPLASRNHPTTHKRESDPLCRHSGSAGLKRGHTLIPCGSPNRRPSCIAPHLYSRAASSETLSPRGRETNGNTSSTRSPLYQYKPMYSPETHSHTSHFPTVTEIPESLADRRRNVRGHTLVLPRFPLSSFHILQSRCATSG